MNKLLILVGAATLALSAAAAEPEGLKIETNGKLRTGIVAIGGETTGAIIETKQGNYELTFKDRALQQKAEKLNGKVVDIAGTLEIRKGVEVKQRKIITVTRLEEAKAK